MNELKPKISIGIPAFNAEETIEKIIKSILNQSIQDFEVIISDNASKDKTLQICRKYEKKDLRFKIFNQEKNMGPYWNFNFVLNKAQGEYFVWFAVDDEHEKTFLEKNLIELEKNKKLIGSISDVKYFGGSYIENSSEGYFQKFKNKFKYRFDKRSKFIQTFPAFGTYEKKSTLYLRMDRSTSLYSVFRRSILKKCMIVTPFGGSDLAIILNVLKHGDIHVVDEILMKKYLGGYSSNGIISHLKNQNTGKIGLVFVNLPFTIWCAKNLGKRIFLKNWDWFIIINIYGAFLISSDLIQILKKRFS
jgi:glycosyltransferase involved in cell wall biosynthesis